MSLLDDVTTYMEQHQLLPPDGEVIVAVSGGADSLCLLHLLWQLCGPQKRYPMLRLRAAHLNHRLRGEASFQDAEAIASLTSRWNIPITLGDIDVPALARLQKRSLEDAARIARYRFLREAAEGQPIAVAHHADDQAETLLLHWLRGGGLAGMIGMQPRQQDIIRPLLATTHAQTVAYCQQHGIVPLEDASNTDPRFLRNRIRHELLPLLESLNPGIRSTLLRNAQVMHVDLEWIEKQVDTSWPMVVMTEQKHATTLELNALLALPLSLQRHLIRRVTARLCTGQSPLELRHYRLIEQLLQKPRNHRDHQERTLHLPSQLQITRNFNTIIFERLMSVGPRAMNISPFFSSSELGVTLPLPGHTEVPGTPWIAGAELLPSAIMQEARQALQEGNWLEVWRILPASRYVVYINADTVGSHLEVRTRQAGDHIQPLGMVHEKKVQDVLVDKAVPRRERANIPLFFSGPHCIWLAGTCLSERVRLTSQTERIVRLSINQK